MYESNLDTFDTRAENMTSKEDKIKECMKNDPITCILLKASFDNLRDNPTISKAFAYHLATLVAKNILYNSCKEDITVNMIARDFYPSIRQIENILKQYINTKEFEELLTPISNYINSVVKLPEFNDALQPVKDLAKRQRIVNILDSKDDFSIRALDIYNNKFNLHGNDYGIIKNNIDKIIEIQDRLNISFEDVLTSGEIKFCVVYDGLDGIIKKGNGRIILMPEDIFRYLIDNDFPSSIIRILAQNESLSNYHFGLKYNFIPAFKKMIKLGKGFKAKQNLLGSNKDNLLDTIRKTYNPVTYHALSTSFIEKFSKDKYMTLKIYCTNLNININTLMYRIAYENMDSDKAIDLGIQETEIYGVGYSINSADENNTKAFDEKDVFYKLIREDILKMEETSDK